MEITNEFKIKYLMYYMRDFKDQIEVSRKLNELDLSTSLMELEEYLNDKIKPRRERKSYWVQRGWSESESIDIANNKKLNNYSIHNEKYWMEFGFNGEESNFLKKRYKIFNPEYWIFYGSNLEDANKNATSKQKNNSKIRNDLYNNDPEYKKECDSKNSITLEYYLSRGYSMDESEKLRSKRQSTFSLEICIDKHGLEEGTKIWKDRQDKWQKTLNITYIDQSNKDSTSIKYIQSIYGKNWFNETITRHKDNGLTDVSAELFTKAYNEKYTLDKLFEEYYKIYDSLDFNEIKNRILKNKIILSLYQTDEKKIRHEYLKYMEKTYVIKKNRYGTYVYHGGKLFKSLKDYEIALFLERNNIEYEYEKKYTININMTFDFYLPKCDTYIEYFGLLSDKTDKIFMDYKNRCNEKLEIFKNENLNVIHSNNIEEIKNSILEIIKHL